MPRPHHRYPPFLRAAAPCALALVGASACSDAPATFGEVKAYTARERTVDWKADDKTRLLLREMGPAGHGGENQAQAPSFTATVPDGWETLPPQQFRDVLWRVKGTDAECALLASVGGGLKGNLDRWCDQFGVPRLSDEQVAAAPAMPLLGKPGKLFELEGTFQKKSDQKLLGIITDTDPQATLKFTGSREVVQQNLDKFLALARSIRVGTAAAAAPGTGYTADLPAGWTQLPSQPERFRDAVFGVPGGDGDCAYTAAVGGGLRGNVDRWTEQFGLPTLTDEQLAAAPQHPLGGAPAKFVELAGTFRGRADMVMLALITDGERASTLKLTAPKDVAAAEKPRFLQLAATVRKGDGVVTAPGAGQAVDAPKGPAPAAPSGHGAPAGTGAFTGTIPAGWTPKAGSSRQLHHTFGADGEVYVSALGGELQQNLDIWRHELQLEPLTAEQFAALPKLPLLGADGVLMDVAGDYAGMGGRRIPGARMLVAARQVDASIVFVKLFGPAGDVAAQVEAFAAFCSSIRRNP